MNSYSTKCLTMIAVTALLSACAREREMAPPQPGWSLITQQKVIIKGESQPLEGAAALSNKEDLRKTLEKIGGLSNTTTKLGQLIRDIRAANETSQVPGMTGLGGVLGRAFLDAAQDTLDRNDFDAGKQVFLSVSGEIQAYEFLEVGNTGQGTGELEVITHVTTTEVPNGPGPIKSKTTTYRWMIDVNDNGNGGFRIVDKDTNDPDDPFPGTMQFTKEMLALIEARQYKYKLWAEGTDIEIKDVARKAGNSSNFVTLPKANPKYANLYREIDDNCIDMLFVDRPPARLGTLEPPLYCLGRCADPLIVNTGV